MLAQVLPTMGAGEGLGDGDGEGDLSPAHLPVQDASALQADALLPAQQPAPSARGGEGQGEEMRAKNLNGCGCLCHEDLEPSRKSQRGSAQLTVDHGTRAGAGVADNDRGRRGRGRIVSGALAGAGRIGLAGGSTLAGAAACIQCGGGRSGKEDSSGAVLLPPHGSGIKETHCPSWDPCWRRCCRQ